MKKTFAIIVSVLALSSCGKYLDMTPRDSVSSKVMWETTGNAEYSINYIYTYIWDLNSSPTDLGLTEALTDEMKYTSYNYNALCYIPSEFAYGDGQTVTATYVDAYLGRWATLYRAIRNANEGLSFLKSYGQMNAADKVRLEAELRFLRGYFYFELAKRYHSVILYGEDLTAIVKDKAVSPEADVWSFVHDDLLFAAENLPEAASAGGRLNKGIAYGMISRAMLYAAECDSKYYEDVIDAAKAVKDLGYRLEASYADAFGKSLAAGNAEAILQYSFDYGKGITHSFNYYYTPGGDYALIDSKGGAYGVPTQEIVESYELAAGGAVNWSIWHASTGTNIEPPYDQLEPRFQATILYNGASWKGREIEPYVGGLDGWATWKTDKEPKGRTVTGYYLRKLVDESYDVSTSASSQPFTFLRYAEVLLNAAEAYFKTGKEEEANDCVKQIRDRVQLPSEAKNGDALFAAIKQERKVELAFEGLRYWDLRRWKDADKDYPTGLCGYQQHGLRIEKTESGYVYTYVSVDEKDRKFVPGVYQFPMPLSELNSNSLVNQYPEWR